MAGLVFLLLVSGTFQPVNAAVLARYQFETSPGRTVSSDTAAQTIAADLTCDGFTPA